MTAIEVPTAYPRTPLTSVGSISAQASTQIAVTALTGARLAATLRHTLWNGTARSRENANIMREEAVTDAVPQNSCAITAMSSRNCAQVSPSASVQMEIAAAPA